MIVTGGDHFLAAVLLALRLLFLYFFISFIDQNSGSTSILASIFFEGWAVIMKFFRCLFWLLLCFWDFFPTEVQAGTQSIALVDNAQQAEGFEIYSFVTTDRGNTFIAAKSEEGAYHISPRVLTEGQPLFKLKSGSVASGLLAHNSGSRFDTLAIMSYHPADGYQLHVLNLRDKADGSGKEFIDDSMKIDHVVGSCSLAPNHMSISGGFQGQIAFSSDCLFGMYDLGLRRVTWSLSYFEKVYAAIPPAIDSRGRAYFLVRPGGRRLQIIRSCRYGGYETIDSFDEPPSSDVSEDLSVSGYPFNGMIILADDSVLLTGPSAHKRIIPGGDAPDLVLPSNAIPWGVANAVSTQEAFYLSFVDSDTQLSIRKIPFSSNEQPVTQPQIELTANSQQYLPSIGLIRDNSALKLVYFANGDLFRQNIENLDSAPEHSDVVTSTETADTFEVKAGLASPVDLLLAGKEAFVKGTRTVRQFPSGNTVQSSTLYRLVNKVTSDAPFTKNLRGFWAQPGADEQHSNSVPAGVEVFLDDEKFVLAQQASGNTETDPVLRAALVCHPLNDPDNKVLIPERGVFLNSNQRLLSVFHYELTHFNKYADLVNGMQCEPFTLTLAMELPPVTDRNITLPEMPELDPNITETGHQSCDRNTTAIEAAGIPDTDDFIIQGALVPRDSLGDPFQLQLVERGAVPLWATNVAEINGVLSSEVSKATFCLQERNKCNGYRRLVIGGSKATNRSDLIIPATIFGAVVFVFLGTATMFIVLGIKDKLQKMRVTSQQL